jgi:hypothetical protein
MKHPAASYGVSKDRYDVTQIRHPRMFQSGVQSEFRLDSRQEHAGMTDSGGSNNRLYAASCGESTR